MKITKIYGCTASDLIFDGISTTDIEFSQTEVLDHLLPKLREAIERGEVGLDRLMDLFPYESSETSEQCETCGDSVETTMWKI